MSTDGARISWMHRLPIAVLFSAALVGISAVGRNPESYDWITPPLIPGLLIASFLVDDASGHNPVFIYGSLAINWAMYVLPFYVALLWWDLRGGARS